MQTLKLIFFAGLGGFFGSALRYLVGRLFSLLDATSLPAYEAVAEYLINSK